MSHIRTQVLAALTTAALFASLASSRGQIYAYDDAGNGVVWTNNPLGVASQKWTNGMSTGYGWTTPWVLVQTVRDDAHKNYAGFYNGNGSNIATTNNSSWGMYANGNYDGVTPLYNGTNRAVAYRGFPALTTNQVFKLQWQSKGIASGGTTNNRGGFNLRTGMATNSFTDYDTGLRFGFFFAAGGGSFLIRDGSGVNATGIPFTSSGFNCEFTLLPGDLYRFVVRSSLDDTVVFTTDSQPLAGAGTIDSVACFDFQCQDGDQNFNRMQIVAAAQLPPVVINVKPANGSYFVSPTNRVTFEVTAAAAVLASTNVTLTLNGVTQPLAFNTSGATTHLYVTNTAALGPNISYRAGIRVTDLNGNSVTNAFNFNTYQPDATWLDVRDFGAVGDGVAMDTAAIQSAIAACPTNGFIWLRNGTFLSGMISLKSRTTFFIDPTATLLGSGAMDDYPYMSPPITNGQLLNCRRALLYAQGCTNIMVTGGGTINGNGRANFRSGLEATRPIAIWPVSCNGVTLQDFNIVDAAMWTVVPMESDNVTVSNLNINDDGLGGNRDGIDPVDCWNVTISDCVLNTGDDAICLKSGSTRGVKNVLVKNCTVTKSQSNGFKFGTATKGPMTNVVFQDCTLRNVSHSAMAVESVDGSAIGNVTFQRINFSSCQNAIFIVLGSRSGATPGTVTGVTFRDIAGTAMTDLRGSPISGLSTNGNTYRVKNLVFDNVDIVYKGGVSSVPADPAEYVGQYPENTMWGNTPAYGYYLRHVTNVVFTNCYTGLTTTDARPWLATNDVAKLTVLGPVLDASPTASNVVLRWKNSFILQAATNVNGTYQDVGGAPNPYTNTFNGGPKKFFKLRQ